MGIRMSFNVLLNFTEIFRIQMVLYRGTRITVFVSKGDHIENWNRSNDLCTGTWVRFPFIYNCSCMGDYNILRRTETLGCVRVVLTIRFDLSQTNSFSYFGNVYRVFSVFLDPMDSFLCVWNLISFIICPYSTVRPIFSTQTKKSVKGDLRSLMGSL